jgi:hypothetical protein
MSYRTNLTAQIENALQQVLEHEADTRARETGFVQRQRKLTGSTFARLMLFGRKPPPLQARPSRRKPSSNALPQKPRTSSTPCSNGLAASRHHHSAPLRWSPLLQRFAGVFIKDSTVIPLPRALASVWQGLGDSQGTSAAVKLQVRGDLRTGQLAGPPCSLRVATTARRRMA